MGTASYCALVLEDLKIGRAILEYRRHMSGSENNSAGLNTVPVRFWFLMGWFDKKVTTEVLEKANKFIFCQCALMGSNFTHSMRESYTFAKRRENIAMGRFNMVDYTIYLMGAMFCLLIVGGNVVYIFVGKGVACLDYNTIFIACVACLLHFQFINIINSVVLALTYAQMLSPERMKEYSPKFAAIAETIGERDEILNTQETNSQ